MDDGLLKLSESVLFAEYVIKAIDGNDKISKFLRALGFVEDARVRAVHRRRQSCITAYEVFGVIIALRRSESERIIVEELCRNEGCEFA